MWEHMVSGAVAACASTVVTYPLDLARSRLAVTPRAMDAVLAQYVTTGTGTVGGGGGGSTGSSSSTSSATSTTSSTNSGRVRYGSRLFRYLQYWYRIGGVRELYR